MDSEDAAGATGASADREAIVARERAEDERSRLADERGREAEDREATANERERKADEREAVADAREREADRREAAATERQHQIDKREQETDEHGRRLGAAVEGLEQRMLDTIEDSRALLALSAQRLNRQEAGVKRSQEHRERQQEEISRASADTERRITDWLPDPGALAEQGKILRKRARRAVQAFKSNEEEAARIYQDLAARNPKRRKEYLDEAQKARIAAHSAQEFLSRFPD